MRLLYDVCLHATTSDEAPFKALFDSYDELAKNEDIGDEQDRVIFRLLMRIGESAARASRAHQPVDLVQCLSDILESKGIELYDIHGGEDVPATSSPEQTGRKKRDRRVSFDEARMEETWLSANSQSINPPAPEDLRPGRLEVPGWAGRSNPPVKRSRSASLLRNLPALQPAPRVPSIEESHLSASKSEDQGRTNPTLYFEPSQTQLEQNAEAFLSTSEIRYARRVLHYWHDQTLRIKSAYAQSFGVAEARDRRTLLKQAFEILREAYGAKKLDRQEEGVHEENEIMATHHRQGLIMRKALRHWINTTVHERLNVRVAHYHLLRTKYFRRWRNIANENQTKIRSILCRKYLALWRERTLKSSLRQEQALAHYEEALMRRCRVQWLRAGWAKFVRGWHDRFVLRTMLSRMVDSCRFREHQERLATSHFHAKIARRAVRSLSEHVHALQQRHAAAERLYDRAVVTRALHGVQTQTRLHPLARDVGLRVRFDLQRKAFAIWHRGANLSRQAEAVDRQRKLQNAWTAWNDGLRCRALAHKIDDRLVVENLYRWALQERYRLFRRAMVGRLLGRALLAWRNKVAKEMSRLEWAAAVFAQQKHRRAVQSGMVCLHLTMRQREDSERTAVEFASSRLLPRVLHVWKGQAIRARSLNKWARDARFYYLTTHSLSVWWERTVEQKERRQKAAYAQIKAREKIRIVGDALRQWRLEAERRRSMSAKAARQAENRRIAAAASILGLWRARTGRLRELSVHAESMDQQKLLSSGFTAFFARSTEFQILSERAEQFQQQTDFALLASALRRLLWDSFTAARRNESAEALWLRTRDLHIRFMIRHWSVQASERRMVRQSRSTRAGRFLGEDGPDSPSLGPANRAASRTSATRPSSPPQAASGTPRYIGSSPLRSRRAGRFRPIPTPALNTPLRFDPAYWVTTPAPTLSRHINRSTSEDVDADEMQVPASPTPQVTAFARKLRAGGFAASAPAPPSAMRSAGPGGTGKSVRFARPGAFAQHR